MLVLQEVEGAQVVEADDMVVVLVGQHDGLQSDDALPEHLLPEVRPGVNDHVAALVRQQQRGAQPLVTGVGGGAHFAVAADSGYALRGASAEECCLQLGKFLG